jgi:hypothetical protein
MQTALLSLLALVCYFGAHSFRCVRLYILSLGQRKHGARLVAAHCATVWANAIIPFKLGEFLRLATLSVAVKSPFSGGGIWLIERLSDAIAIIVLVLALSPAFPLVRDSMVALWLAAGFIGAIAFGAWMLMEAIPYLRDDLVLRSRSRKGMVALRLVHQLDLAMRQAKQLLVGRFSLTLLVGLMIWSLEFAAIALWSAGSGEQRSLLSVLLSTSGSEATAQRLPVFIGFSIIGVVIFAGIVFRLRQQRHA